MTTKSELVRQQILSSIQEGRWQAGTQLPSLLHLAAEMGVSHWTVERALQRLIHEGVLQRQPKCGTFVRDGSLANIYQNATIAIAGQTPAWWLRGNYFGPLMGAFADELGDRDWLFLQHQPNEETAKRLRLLGVPFLIMPVPTIEMQPALERFAANGFNVLCIGAHVRSNFLHSVCADNEQGVMTALNYLVQLGHRRIAFIAWRTNHFDMAERLAAFRRGAKRFQLLDAEELLMCADDVPSESVLTERALERWFAHTAPPPTAILTGGGDFTHPLLAGLMRRALRIPQDVSLLTFDDYAQYEALPVPVTAIRQPLETMGRRTAQLLSLLPGHVGPPFQLVFPTELVVRESCAPPQR